MPTRFSSSLRTALRASVLLALTCAVSGCVSDNRDAMAMAPAAGGTVAFESIDGPPPQVFDRMVGILDSESKLRNVSVVSREAPAAYRVRGYLAAQVRRGRTTISWVWDVYDRNQQRTLRLSGEEAAGKVAGDAWASADDVVLRRIAQAGMGGLSGMLNGSGAPDAPPEPQSTPEAGPAVASADSRWLPSSSPAAPSSSPTAGTALSFAAR